MYLLNNLEIRNSVAQANKSYLAIDKFENQYLQHTFYYFRLGSFLSTKKATVPLTSNKINLPPESYINIESLETFYLGDRIFSIIGQSTELIMSGIQLNYSPFIDPLFQGRLRLGIKNFSQDNIDLEIGQIIGKVSFFDITDSLPIKVDMGSIIEDKFRRRLPLRDDDPVHPDPDDDE